jgi:hypothetical protein
VNDSCPNSTTIQEAVIVSIPALKLSWRAERPPRGGAWGTVCRIKLYGRIPGPIPDSRSGFRTGGSLDGQASGGSAAALRGGFQGHHLNWARELSMVSPEYVVGQTPLG